MGVSFSKVPCLSRGIVDDRELGERAYEVCRGDERAARKDFLREAYGEAETDHAVLLRILGVEQ